MQMWYRDQLACVSDPAFVPCFPVGAKKAPGRALRSEKLGFEPRYPPAEQFRLQHPYLSRQNQSLRDHTYFLSSRHLIWPDRMGFEGGLGFCGFGVLGLGS